MTREERDLRMRVIQARAVGLKVTVTDENVEIEEPKRVLTANIDEACRTETDYGFCETRTGAVGCHTDNAGSMSIWRWKSLGRTR